MKVFILLAGNGWDINVGRIETAFANEFSAVAEVQATRALDDYIDNRGGRHKWHPEGKETGWEIGGVSANGARTYRFRKDGRITEQFVALLVKEAKL